MAFDLSEILKDVPTPDTSRDVIQYLPYANIIPDAKNGYSMDALVFSKTMKDYRVHSGIDILAPVGATVVAYTDGRVKSVSDDYFYGTTVEIEHAEGMTSCYMNLDPSLAAGIAEGAEVRTGQMIGTVGTSARIEQKDEPHLHFELKVNGKTIDPLTELPD